MSTISQAQQELGQQNWDNLCQAFVEQITQGRTGLYGSAIEAWQAQQNKGSTDFSKMQPGDAIYFSPNAGNNYSGHTGIYEGNGMMISATPNGVAETSVDQWMQSTGQQALGYVPQKGDGQQALVGARKIGTELNGFIGQAFPQKIQALQGMQMQMQRPTLQPPMQFGQQKPNLSNPFTNQPGQPLSQNVKMPTIQNPAASSPMPIQGMMTSMSPAGQNAGINQPGSGTPTMMPSAMGRLGPQNVAYSAPQGYGGYAGGSGIPVQGAQVPQFGNAQSIIAQAPPIPDITPSGGTTPTIPLTQLVAPQ